MPDSMLRRTTSQQELDVAIASGGLDLLPPRYPGRYVAGAFVAVAVVWSLVLIGRNPNFQWDVVLEYLTFETIVAGVIRTIELTVIAQILGIVLGTVLAIMRLSKNPILQVVSNAYVWVFRGVPALVQLIFWYNLSALFDTIGFTLGPLSLDIDANSVITPFTAAILGLGLCEAGYMAEIIRSGIQNVDVGQREAAAALGFRPRRVMSRVVLPQAMRAIIPPTGNQTVNMLKSTSLVSVLALPELLYSAQNIYARTYETVPLLLVVAIWYLAMTSVMSVAQYYIERHYSKGVRR